MLNLKWSREFVTMTMLRNGLKSTTSVLGGTFYVVITTPNIGISLSALFLTTFPCLKVATLNKAWQWTLRCFLN